MTRRLSSISVLLNSFLVITFGVNLASCQDASSLLSGLLSTFAESSKSPGCPGECRHALSALFCSYIQEDADCGDSKLRCCTDPPPEVAETYPEDVEHDPSHDDGVKFNSTMTDDIDPPDRNRPTDGDHTFHRPPMLTQATPISVGTNLTVRPGQGQGQGVTPSRPGSLALRRRITTTTPSSASVEVTDRMTATMIPTPAALTGVRVKPPASSQRPCHGICVTRMVASFCSQIYEFGQCSPGEACCLTGDEAMEPEAAATFMVTSMELTSTPMPSESTSTFGTRERTSSRLPTTTTTTTMTTMMTTTPTMTTMQQSSPGTTPSFSDTAAATAATTMATTTVSVIRRRRPSSSRPPIINNRHKQSSSPSTSTRVPPRQPDDDEQLEECPGSCILGLLSLLCDGVDSTVTCANGGQCCISKSSSPSGIDSSKVSTPRPAIRNCPGICLPSMLTGVCNKPAVLIPDALDCDPGTVCCDNSLRETGQATTTSTASPLMDLLAWPLKLAAASGGSGLLGGDGSASSNINSALSIGSALSGLFGGSGGASTGSNGGNTNNNGNDNTHLAAPSHMAPPTFSSPGHNMMSSQPNPEADQPAIDRIQTGTECPGTCIASFLKMTCFGSSQVVESFFCPKDNLVCCAPRTSLIGLNPDFMNNDNHWNHTANHLSPADSAGVVGYSQRPSNNRYVCGMKGAIRPETPRVVGGRDASPGEWCWQVALINSLNQYLCGGALIGRQWVLTAAHCVTNLIRSGDVIYIRVGDYDLTSKYGSPGAQTLRVATTYIHHNHNSQTLDNNIALLKLEKHVDLKEGVCLVCLPARGVVVQPGKRCFVTGYGYMGESGPIPLRIRAAMLPVVSEQECVRKINAVTEKIFILPASSFCAGGEEGHDACQGDGGGPMSCEVDGYYEITGIVSWGFGCGRLDVPGIYVKVSSFIGWINQIISVNNI